MFVGCIDVCGGVCEQVKGACVCAGVYVCVSCVGGCLSLLVFV